MILSVCMITYNHEKYIAQAIESALMQKTNFDYEIVIGEDCSTDRTREIVFEYAKKNPDKIIVITSEKNVGANENFIRTLNSCRGKYIAILEGDDYWTDPYKLQKQANFLESNQDYGLVHSDVNFFYQNNNKVVLAYKKKKKIKIPIGSVFENLLLRNFISTPTVCFRRSFIENIDIEEIIKKDWLLGDWALWLEIASKSLVGYLPEPFATYRIHSTSITNKLDKIGRYKFILSSYDIRFYYISKYGCSKNIKKLFYIDYYKAILHNSYYTKDKQAAKKAYDLLRLEANHYDFEAKLMYWAVGNPIIFLFERFYVRIKKKIYKTINMFQILANIY